MLKRLLIIILSTLYLVLSAAIAKAQNEFSTDALVTYKVQDNGKTTVTHEISVVNNFSTLYATTYTLSLENITADNIKAYNDKGTAYPVDIQKNGEKSDIKVAFSDPVVGKGAKRHFFISYESGAFAVRTGEIWEVSIPRLTDTNSFNTYTVKLLVPAGFGLEAYISPLPSSFNDAGDFKNYIFTKEKVSQVGITAGFGQFQVFTFNLSYHLENPLTKRASTEIAIPPDTAFQKVYFSKIEPGPTNVRVDNDGNWLAVYNLEGRERVDVNVTGSVQIFSSFRPFPKPSNATLSDNLKETQYWQVDSPQIKALAATLKTPKEIYDYVTTTLKYDFGRVQPNVQRFGAVNALQNPGSAICMEFTDLFIAIARAAGIPAREVNGYAYTENPDLQPLSLVADVLHAWPEYYDKDKGAWIPVDPTWGSTSKIDYFNKLDLRHFAFVVHGKDSSQPFAPGSYKLGPNPQKDVFVNFGKLPANRIGTPLISAEVKRNIPFLNLIYKVTIKNPGPAGLYSLYPTVYFDGVQSNRNFIEAMPPFSSFSFNVSVPFSILGKDTPERVRIEASGSQITVPTNKTQVIINSLLVLSLTLILVTVGILIRLKKITFNSFFAKITGAYDKIAGKFKKNKNSSGV